MSEFNFFAILLAAVLSFILGGLYVALFRKLMLKLQAKTTQKTDIAPQNMQKKLAGVFAANVVMALGLAYFIKEIDVRSVLGALQLAMWTFIGFVAPISIGSVIWEGQSVKLWIFNNVINFICLCAMSLLLTYWR